MHAAEKEIFYGVLIVAGVFGLITLAFIFSVLSQHRKRIALYKAKLTAEIKTLEEERMRMSADLHDALSPALTSAKLYITKASRVCEDEEALDKALTHIDGVVNQMRSIAFNLMPRALAKGNLAEAVRAFLSGFDHSELEISFDSDPLPPLSENVNVNVFRIIQEIVNNTIKHADASTLRVKLGVEGDKLILQTKDNGRGFEPSGKKINDRSGSGLGNIESRADHMGATLFRESPKGKGSYYRVEVPVTN